ncbi:unnamed protein product [Triticum turgidum subsp. durum]|uniref:NAD-dependent epimerase/dehydratase domain-containing protein n=1 Tax=Triticum turgidum subsp. durum TaxID=4567 RepID=A0A9R0WX45_TRITD|nr:unnamed protein product [Triticum turgidum subsp. durum]
MSRVCVTGAAGYIAAWLVGKLLQRGCIVHATLRSLLDEEKTAVLTVLPGAAERLTLFEADIYNATTFEPAIQGREFVFLVATPLMHDNSSTKYKSVTEAIVDAHRLILQQCERSKTVRRIIHTAPGERSWVQGLDERVMLVSAQHPLQAYVASKSLSEQELLRHNESEGGRAFEVVTLACGLVGGDTLHPVLSSRMSSVTMVVAALTGNEIHHNALCFMQALLGSVPLVHIDDACAVHLFCMDQPSMAGRFLCAAGYPTMQDYVARFAAKYPEHKIILKELAGEGVRVPGDSSKLVELGFRFKYSVEETLDCSVECAKRMGEL